MGRDTGRHRTGARNLGPVLLLALATPTLQAQDNPNGEARPDASTVQMEGYWPATDTSGWACRLCPEPNRRKGTVTAGAGYVSDPSEKFGDKSGLDDDGAVGILQAEVRMKGEDTGYIEAEAAHLALDSRRLLLEGGRQGEFDLVLSYSSLPHFIAESAQTVYLNAGAGQLQLPADWQQQSSTRAMNLGSHLQPLQTGVDRHEYRVGGNYQTPEHWQYALDYRRTEQDGLRLQGAAFLTAGTTLPVPVDRVTDRLDAAVSYVERDWQIQASYHGSTFKNQSPFVIWDNPFTPLAAGGERGLLAQEPDNNFNQLSLSGRWRILPILNTSAHLTLGRMEQDETFVAPTINPEIGNVANPRSTLDGQVDIFSTRIQAVTQARKNLTLTGEAWLQDRDNNSAQDLYLQVSNDLARARERYNRPYSFKRKGGRLRADYRVNPTLQFSSGIGREEFERSLQEVEKTGTTDYWAQMRAQPASSFDIRLRIDRELRRFIDGHEPLPDLASPENPLLRKFNLSERDRDAVGSELTFAPTDKFSVSWSLDYAFDEYAKGWLGLTEAREFSQTLDVSSTPVEKLTLYGFLTRQRLDSLQDGSSAFSLPDWNGRQKDVIDTAGLGTELRDLGPFAMGIELGYSSGQGQMQVRTNNSGSGFPDQETELASIKIFGLYTVDEKLSLRLDYRYEKLRTEDFFIDPVEPATIPNWLAVGQESPDYEVHVLGLSAVYKF